MNTTVTKIPGAFHAILLLRALQTPTQPPDFPFTPRKIPTFHSQQPTLSKRIPAEILDLAVPYHEKSLLTFPSPSTA
jgi:hypothetical protein